MFGDNILEIPETINILAQCWLTAEENLRKDINTSYPDADEEFITRMFHGKYSAILRVVSDLALIENAFLNDLRNAFQNLDGELNQIANGLIAEVTLHKRGTERLTGGDIGILIIRPHIEHFGDVLKISDY